MITRNIWNQRGEKIHFTLKRQEYTPLEFVSNTKPVILAYQIMDWWMPINESQNKKNYNKLTEMSWGVEYHKGKITIEVYAVLRQRLLQQGQTSYFTYDFETSQNLFVSTNRRGIANYAYGTSKTNGRKKFNDTRFDYEVYDAEIDMYDREEIPQREKKTIEIHFEKPNHRYMYRPEPTNKWMEKITENNKNTVKTLVIPGPTGYGPTATIQNGIETSAYHNTEIIIEDKGEDGGVDEHHINWATTINRASYPLKVLHPPKVTDETGEMKWYYETRISTELDVTFHIKPDIYRENELAAFQRQILPHPFISMSNSQGPQDFVRYTCVPYEL